MSFTDVTSSNAPIDGESSTISGERTLRHPPVRQMALDNIATKESGSDLGSGEPTFHYEAPTYPYEAIRGSVMKKAWCKLGRNPPEEAREERYNIVWAVGLLPG